MLPWDRYVISVNISLFTCQTGPVHKVIVYIKWGHRCEESSMMPSGYCNRPSMNFSSLLFSLCFCLFVFLWLTGTLDVISPEFFILLIKRLRLIEIICLFNPKAIFIRKKYKRCWNGIVPSGWVQRPFPVKADLQDTCSCRLPHDTLPLREFLKH